MEVTQHGVPAVTCDGCGHKQLAGDAFDPFYISYPCGFHNLTGEPLAKFLYQSLEPLQPRKYHACPECAKNIRGAVKKQGHGLPPGRLRDDLRGVLQRSDNKMMAFQIHFLKNSRLGEATA